MTNKKKLKKVMEEEIEKNKIYNDIMNKINKKNNIWKLSIVCVSLVIVCFIYIGKSNNKVSIFNKNTNLIEESTSRNEIEEVEPFDRNLTIKKEDNIPYPYKDADVPTDLVNINKYAIYSNDYDSLNVNNYIIEYINEDRYINVAYSKNDKPLRDYFIDGEGSSINIHNIKLNIYKKDIKYYVEFNYNSYNYNIETSNITLEELINFLNSILEGE